MRRSTVVLVFLFAALGLLYWYMQKPGNVIKQALATSTTTSPQSLPDLIRPDQGPVSQISVQRADGKIVTLKKAGGIWLVATDHEAPANQDTSETIALNALSWRTIAKLEKTLDLASIGLSSPAYTVSLVLLDGSPYTFKVGNATVTGSGYYVQANDGSIVVVDKYAIDALANMIVEPPFLVTTTPLPNPATETPIPPATPETTSTPDVTPTTKP
jgi:hypothetical protein